MKNVQKYLLVFTSLAVAASCAKERSVNKVEDADANRFAKATFTDTGVWLTKATIVNTSSIGGLGFVGLQSDTKAGKFVFTKDKMKFVQAYSPEKNNSMLDEVLNTWDITHSEYRLSESSGVVTNSEQENNSITWNRKTYFKVDLSKSSVSGIALDSPCWTQISSELVSDSQEVSSQRISYEVDQTYKFNPEAGDFACAVSSLRRFTTGQDTHTIRMRYSYLKQGQNKNYNPYLYEGENDPVMKRYGYFNSVVEKIRTSDDRLENQFLMNKWGEGEHTFYFAHDFPEEYKWVYNHPQFGVMARTNKIFKDNGINVSFKIVDAPADIKFGDLGKSFIKFIKEDSLDAPLGYGPSDTDPLTGEIISANSMIWTSSLKFYINLINESLKAEADRADKDKGSSLYDKMKQRLGSDVKNWVNTSEALKFNSVENKYNSNAGKIFSDLLPDYTFARSSLYSLGMEPIERQDQLTKELNRIVDKSAPFVADNAVKKVKETLEQTEKFDKANEKNYFFKMNSPTTLHNLEEKLVGAEQSLIKGFSPAQIVDTIVYRVSIHEFGHNLNLRHNFYGSVDGKNFDKNVQAIDRNGKALSLNGQPLMTDTKTASVMDYQNLTDEMREPWDWGKYDKAALTFAYSDGKIDLGLKNKTNYLYCTDEHRTLNAMCNTWDAGTTPTEVVMSLIQSYDNAYAYTNYRFGRAYWNTLGYGSRALGTMRSLRKFLSFNQDTFQTDSMAIYLSKKEEEIPLVEVNKLIKDDMRKANLIVASFYDAVIRQADAERPWSSVYENWSGALKRQGIAQDKIYATLFLLGDIALPYDNNRSAPPISYIGLLNQYTDVEDRDIMEQIIVDNLTSQPAMEQGFITFGRSLYANTVTNYVYNDNPDWYANIELKCISPNTFKNKFGFSPNNFPKIENGLVTSLSGSPLPLESADLNTVATKRVTSEIWKPEVVKFLAKDDVELGQDAEVAVVAYGGNYLMASSVTNKYAFDILKSVVDSPLFSKESDAQYAFEFYKSLRESKGIPFNGTCE